jgi:hypothetical protein
MPQRVYIAPIALPPGGAAVDVQVEGLPGSRMVVHDLVSGRNGPAIAYVRLNEGVAPPWALARQTYYCNDVEPDCRRAHVPFIFGGDCVCIPSDEMMRCCYEHGVLRGVTADELAHVYEMEGIRIEGRSAGTPGLHVLEGGDWLYTPKPGSAGYARLYGRPAVRAWRLRSDDGRALAARVNAAGALASRE